MQGVVSPSSQRGIIPRAFEHMFEAISTAENSKFLVQASYLEIYNEEIRDLLGLDVKKKLELKENNVSGVYVSGISSHPVHNVSECEKIMEKGWKSRATGATLMNADSSRSHSIFTVYVERISTDDDDGNIRKGKLNLVDLAGSERQAKTGATGDRLKEATKINLSLSALGNVISALVDGKSKHIPYRDSKLTRLLQDSLGGNTKTLMIACLSPADNNYDETLSTLRYANRAKNIKNKPKVNEDPKDALLREYQEEIKRLKSMISETNTTTTTTINNNASNAAVNNEDTEKIKAEYDEKMQELIAKFKEEQASNEKLKNEMTQLKNKTAASSTNGHDDPMERLAALEDFMVGGEKANDPKLNEKRAERKRIAEKKINAISEALKNFDNDDQLLLKAYGDITEELRARTLLLKKAKKRIIALERDVSDLQSEFEQDRTDYLETIRRQEQQVKLNSQILEKIQPCIRRDCNYSNIERIKNQCVWDDDVDKWRLPDLIVTRTKLPPTSTSAASGSLSGSLNGTPVDLSDNRSNGFHSDHQTLQEEEEAHNSSSSSLSNASDSGRGGSGGLDSRDSQGMGDKFLAKLEKGVNENFPVNYFKSKRRDALLSKKNNGNQDISNANDHKSIIINNNNNPSQPNFMINAGSKIKNDLSDAPLIPKGVSQSTSNRE